MTLIEKKTKMRNNRAAEDILEAQNRERQERLASKSSYLKSLAYDIENEAKDHNRLLGNYCIFIANINTITFFITIVAYFRWC